MRKIISMLLSIAMVVGILSLTTFATERISSDTCCNEKSKDVTRIAGADRCATAREVADAVKDELGIKKFDTILYTSATNFADALAGSYLSAEKSAPVLMHWDGALQDNLTYIQNNLTSDGIVYILGGTAAVPATAEEEIQKIGIRTKRVKGSDRYITNLEILKEVGFNGGTVLVCAGHTFADSLSASATGLPVLLVDPMWTELSKYHHDYLSSFDRNCAFIIIGGTAAVNGTMETILAEYGSVERIYGEDRFKTSIEVAERFFDMPNEAVLAYAWTFPDGLGGGILAQVKKAPLILSDSKDFAVAGTYISAKSITSGAVLGGSKLISDAAVKIIFNQTEIAPPVNNSPATQPGNDLEKPEDGTSWG